MDCAALRRNIERYNGTGLAGYVVAGSTGEAAFLARDERRALFRVVREAAREKVLIAGTGAESVRETLALVQDAAEFSYDAALVLTPHYYRGQMARQETQLAFFRAVADSSPLPIVIYNIPQNTGIDLAAETVGELCAHPNIAAIKESSAELDKVRSLTSALPKTFPVLVGASGKFHDCLLLGAAGGILAVANAVPQATVEIWERFRAGDIAGSRAAQDRIAAVAGLTPRYGIQGLKYALDLRGYYGGPPRPPLLPLDATRKAEIGKMGTA